MAAWKIPGKKSKKAKAEAEEVVEVFGAEPGKTSPEPQAEVGGFEGEEEVPRLAAKKRPQGRPGYDGPRDRAEDGVKQGRDHRSLREAGGASGSAAPRKGERKEKRKEGEEEGGNYGGEGGEGPPLTTSLPGGRKGVLSGAAKPARGAKTGAFRGENSENRVKSSTSKKMGSEGSDLTSEATFEGRVEGEGGGVASSPAEGSEGAVFGEVNLLTLEKRGSEGGDGPQGGKNEVKSLTSTKMAENGDVEPFTPQETVSVAMEQRRPAVFMRRTGVNLEKERRKLDVLPTYACSTCALGPECPEFKEGYVCAFVDSFKAFPVRDVDAVTELMVEIVDTNKVRLRMAQMQERLTSGGMATPDVTRLSEVVLNQAKALIEMQQEVNKVTVSVTGARDEVRPAGQGILSRLFSGGSAGDQVRQVVEVKRPELEFNPTPVGKEETDEPVSRAADDRDVLEDGGEVDPGEGTPGG